MPSQNVDYAELNRRMPKVVRAVIQEVRKARVSKGRTRSLNVKPSAWQWRIFYFWDTFTTPRRLWDDSDARLSDKELENKLKRSVEQRMRELIARMDTVRVGMEYKGYYKGVDLDPDDKSVQRMLVNLLECELRSLVIEDYRRDQSYLALDPQKRREKMRLRGGENDAYNGGGYSNSSYYNNYGYSSGYDDGYWTNNRWMNSARSRASSSWSSSSNRTYDRQKSIKEVMEEACSKRYTAELDAEGVKPCVTMLWSVSLLSASSPSR